MCSLILTLPDSSLSHVQPFLLGHWYRYSSPIDLLGKMIGIGIVI